MKDTTTNPILPKRRVPAPARMFYAVLGLWVTCFFWDTLTSALATAAVLTTLGAFVYAIIPYLEEQESK